MITAEREALDAHLGFTLGSGSQVVVGPGSLHGNRAAPAVGSPI